MVSGCWTGCCMMGFWDGGGSWGCDSNTIGKKKIGNVVIDKRKLGPLSWTPGGVWRAKEEHNPEGGGERRWGHDAALPSTYTPLPCNPMLHCSQSNSTASTFQGLFLNSIFRSVEGQIKGEENTLFVLIVSPNVISGGDGALWSSPTPCITSLHSSQHPRTL